MTITRTDELRNDIDNLYFTARYYVGVLAELEQLGRSNTQQFKQTEKNLNTIKANIRRLEKEYNR